MTRPNAVVFRSTSLPIGIPATLRISKKSRVAVLFRSTDVAIGIPHLPARVRDFNVNGFLLYPSPQSRIGSESRPARD